jgi:hypothetical protein
LGERSRLAPRRAGFIFCSTIFPFSNRKMSTTASPRGLSDGPCTWAIQMFGITLRTRARSERERTNFAKGRLRLARKAIVSYFVAECDFSATNLGAISCWIPGGRRGAKMVGFGRILQGIKYGLRYASEMAAEWLVGVIWMVATIVWSAALAIRTPNIDIFPGNDAGSEKRAARSETWSGSVADRRVRKKLFRVWAYLTVMWCALWIFVFSYGLPAGDQATALQVIAIPPAVLLFVLIIGLRRAVNGRLDSAPPHPAE